MIETMNCMAVDVSSYMMGAAVLLIIGIAIGSVIVGLCAPWPYKDRERAIMDKGEAERALLEEMREHYFAQRTNKETPT